MFNWLFYIAEDQNYRKDFNMSKNGHSIVVKHETSHRTEELECLKCITYRLLPTSAYLAYAFCYGFRHFKVL